MSLPIADRVRDAGIVGAGGAGFPTHVKFAAQADTVIANGAECEPLLQCDKAVMRLRTEEVLRGLELLAEAVGAERMVIALKGKYGDVVRRVRQVAGEKFPAIEVYELDNYYQVLRDQPYRGVVLVCPYPPRKPSSAKYQRYLLEELIPYTEKHLRVFDDADRWGVDGISLGGLLSTHLGLTLPFNK